MEYLKYVDCKKYCLLYNRNIYEDEYIQYGEYIEDNYYILKQYHLVGLLHRRNGPAFLMYRPCGELVHKEWYICGNYIK